MLAAFLPLPSTIRKTAITLQREPHQASGDVVPRAVELRVRSVFGVFELLGQSARVAPMRCEDSCDDC